MTTKSCNTCKIEKELILFSQRKKNVYHGICKECINKYAKEYRQENKEKIKEKQNEWYSTAGKEWKKQYEDENREYINTRDREKYKNDDQYRMKKILRSRFKKTITGEKKYKSILSYLDVSVEYFNKWIEYQFDYKMTWENQGIYWEIDHVIPCSSFDFSNEEQIKKCFNWKNMRPLERIENYSKNNKIIQTIIDDHYKTANEYILKHPVPS
jgi:hypothetical protein